MSQQQTYKMPFGLGTYFSEYDRPLTFAKVYTNRFRNVNGGSERRPGCKKFEGTSVDGKPNLTRMHEFVTETGEEILFSSDDSGNLYKYSSSAWSTILTGKSEARMLSVNADAKLIFCNGIDRNFYTDDGSTFKELKAYITKGKLTSGSNSVTVVDSDITNWIGNTLVANNDIVHNVTKGAYGIVSTVASASLTITNIGTSAKGAGYATSNQASGDVYELLDYVDMNIIPDGAGGFDNIAVMTSGTSTTKVSVSGVDFSSTEAREDDFIYNTTRGAVSRISSVSANISLKDAITGQVSGDSVVFLKSAMPITSWIHVHYGRCYYLDARNNQRAVVAAPDDPEDVTTYQKTLDASSVSFASTSPIGDSIMSMGTFLSYFVAAGKKNLYIYQGATPVSDNSSTTISFTPIATFPNGVASKYGIATTGSSLFHITLDGLQSISMGYNAYSTNQENISMPIFEDFKNAVNNSSEDDIQLTYYPRRRWLINKVGDQCYILNVNPVYSAEGQQQPISSWHLFTGKWAQQNHYFVRRNGDLISCGSNGSVYKMDDGDFTDDGEKISTQLDTAWLRMEEPQATPRIKEGHYIRPVFESSSDLEYTISVMAGLDGFSSDSITVSAGNTGAVGSAIIGITPIGGGSYAQSNKFPLRWRGEQAKISFTSESSAENDVITAFTLYGDIHGVR